MKINDTELPKVKPKHICCSLVAGVSIGYTAGSNTIILSWTEHSNKFFS